MMTEREEQYLKYAQKCLADDDLEVDEDPKVSIGTSNDPDDPNPEPGAWVRTWTWVRQEELETFLAWVNRDG